MNQKVIIFSFPEERPDALVKLQAKHWNPILDWVKLKHGVEISIFSSVFQTTQPKETLEHFSEVLARMDKWTLAGECSNFANFELLKYTNAELI